MQEVVNSGGFVETADGTTGILAIHVADYRQHRPPQGWKFTSSFIEGDYELFVYERNA